MEPHLSAAFFRTTDCGKNWERFFLSRKHGFARMPGSAQFATFCFGIAAQNFTLGGPHERGTVQRVCSNPPTWSNLEAFELHDCQPPVGRLQCACVKRLKSVYALIETGRRRAHGCQPMRFGHLWHSTDGGDELAFESSPQAYSRTHATTTRRKSRPDNENERDFVTRPFEDARRRSHLTNMPSRPWRDKPRCVIRSD